MGLETDRTGTPFSLADFALEQHPAKLLRARKAGRSSRRRSVMRSVCDAELASAGAARRRGRCTTTRRRRCNMGSDGSHCWPQGWHSSALSWWCSTCCSCTRRRRTRCCSHRSPSTLAHSATRSQAALRGWQEAGRRCFWTSSRWPSSGRARLQRGGTQELALYTLCPPRCAPVPREAVRTRSGRPLIVEPGALCHLAEPYRSTAELPKLPSL